MIFFIKWKIHFLAQYLCILGIKKIPLKNRKHISFKIELDK